MATNALTPLMYEIQQGFQNFDLKSWVSQLDLKTFGLLAVVVVGIVFLLDLLTKSYAPYGRSLVYSAAHAWDSRDQIGLNDPTSRGSRSLEPLTNVLDALADAVLKWEKSEATTVRSRRAL